MGLKEKFFTEKQPTEEQLATSYRYVVAANVTCNAIFALGTGNFLMGYLAWMGASPAFSARVGALPLLGCVLQAVSPFFFERLRHRKLPIVLMCFTFRFLMGTAAVVPFLFRSGTARQTAVFALYFVAFLVAGFVTPGMNQWLLGSAPMKDRGRFFAKRNTVSSLFNAGLTFSMGLAVDYLAGRGQAQAGYCIVFGTVMLLAVADAWMLANVHESPAEKVLYLKSRDFLRPFRDAVYRPVILFDTLWFMANNFSAAFLPVYLLQGLGLSHSYISALVIVSTVVGMACNWIWGRLADRAGWRAVLVAASALACCGYVGWFFVTPAAAVFAVPVVQCVATAGTSASGMAILNLEYITSPKEGKTMYLGAVAVVANLTGYVAALAASALQAALEPGAGVERSISVLFALSAAGMLACLWHARRNLPKL